MATDRAAEPAFDPGYVRHVIEMPMGQKEQPGFNIETFQPGTGAIRGVKQDGTSRGMEQVAIRFENSSAEALVVHNLLYNGLTPANLPPGPLSLNTRNPDF